MASSQDPAGPVPEANSNGRAAIAWSRSEGNGGRAMPLIPGEELKAMTARQRAGSRSPDNLPLVSRPGQEG